MLLMLHIIIALSSILFTTFVVFRPTQTKISTSYGLVVATIASGVSLVIFASAPMLRMCLTGLVYTALVSIAILVARHRLVLRQVS